MVTSPSLRNGTLNIWFGRETSSRRYSWKPARSSSDNQDEARCEHQPDPTPRIRQVEAPDGLVVGVGDPGKAEYRGVHLCNPT